MTSSIVADPPRPIISCAVVVDLRRLSDHDAGHELERALSGLPAGVEVVLQVDAPPPFMVSLRALDRAGRIRIEASDADVARAWHRHLSSLLGWGR